jgi:hypothetical protein
LSLYERERPFAKRWIHTVVTGSPWSGVDSVIESGPGANDQATRGKTAYGIVTPLMTTGPIV